ncbi:arginine/serine-rich coiled-coil protein 2 isoform X1 [Teleopsis dalmanni]|uniref:arginine/serine-rich coiled-coil protein 2 isoform X1 n=2 Tax=Teleopsis dalmanni TaxID=139649 RepID=UPI000D32C45B|nr:arginine/serine-rich coiled-coil protein 2 isoform X1 [Teleopsis dalmanni]
MEGLVNYSSDEEHEDYGSQSMDARRSPNLELKNGNALLKGVGGVSAANERSNYKNESSRRDKYNATELGSRKSNSPHTSRENDRSNRSTTQYSSGRMVGKDTNPDSSYNNNRTGSRNIRSGSPYTNRDSRSNRAESPFTNRDNGRTNRADSPYTNRDSGRGNRADSPYTNRDIGRSNRADSPCTNRDNGRSNRADSPYTNRDIGRSNRVDSPYTNRDNGRSNRADSPYTNRDNGRNNRADSPYTNRDNGRSNRANSPYAGRDRNRAVSPHDNKDTGRNVRPNSPYGSNYRESGRDNRYKYEKANERSRPKEHFKNDYHTDQRRSQRDEDRSSKHQGNYQSERQSNSSRNERNRYGDMSRRNQSHHYDRSPRRDRDRERNDRFSEQQRRRREDSRSPSPKHRHHRQRSGYNDDKPRYRKRVSRSRSNSASSPRRSGSKDRTQKSRSATQNADRKISTDEGKEKLNPNFNRHSEALLSLPLNNNAPKQPNIIAVTPSTTTTNNGEPAVIQLPSYYNPSVINPNKYAEQVQKRKLIWGAKKSEDTSAKWGNAQFSQDSDGKVASKFMRLMGIKNSAPPTPTTTTEVEKKPTEPVDVKSREDMFSSMEKQYEVARQVTHTMRGVGLGFGSQPRPF